MSRFDPERAFLPVLEIAGHRKLAFGAMLGLALSASSQITLSTGSIQGTIADESGARVNGARVSITDTATRQAASVSTNSEGEYTFAFLKPDEFAVEVEAKGFETMRFLLTVKVGQTTNGSAKVAVGEGSETVDVHASAS